MSQPELRDALFIPQDNRENFKQIIAKRSDLVRFGSGRSAPSTFGTYMYAGLVLGLASSGADAGFLKPYNASNTDGSQVAVAILSEDANVDAAGNGSNLVTIYGSAELYQNLLIGLDNNAIANLGAKSRVENGNTLLYIP